MRRMLAAITVAIITTFTASPGIAAAQTDTIDYSLSFGNQNPIAAYPGAPINTSVSPGDGYTHSSKCSLGPRMTDGESDRIFFAIAAHCVSNSGVGGTVYFNNKDDAPAGKIRWIHPEYTDETDIINDIAVIEVTDTDAVGYTSIIPKINKTPSERVKSPMGNFSLRDFGDNGGTACAIGRKSDLRCGVALKPKEDYAYIFNFDSQVGDSGGIVFAADSSGRVYPLGITSAIYDYADGTMTQITDIKLAEAGGFFPWESSK